MSNEDAATAVQGMKQSVAAGELWLEPGVTEACAGHCETLRSEIDAVIAVLAGVGQVSGFGGFDSGTQLRDGFQTKASAAKDYLMSYGESVNTMAQTFRAAGVAYEAQDQMNSDGLGGAGQGL